MKHPNEFGQLVGFNASVYKGRYFHSGGGFISDAFSQLLPLLKSYSRKKLGTFASKLNSELDQGTSIKSALKRSASTAARSVLKDLTCGGSKKYR